MKRRRTLPPPPLPQVTCLETPPTQCDNWRWVEAGKGHGRDRRSRSLSLTSTPVFWQKPRPRCFRRRRIEDKTHQIPGNRLTALNARLAAGTQVRDQVQSERGPSRQVPGHTDTHETGQTDGQSQRRARARLTAGRRVRRVSGRRRAGFTSQARSGGRRPGRGEGSPGAPSLRTRRAGPAPPLRLSVGLSVGPRVCWSPGRPAPLSAGRPTFQRCPVPRPRRRLGFSIVGPRGRGSERRGPGAHGAGARPPPPPRAPSLRRPHRSLAVPSAQSPALRSDPCPRRSPPAPRPPRPADPGSAATSPPRAGLCLSRSLPPPGSLSPRVAVSVSVALPVCSLPSSTPARSLPCVSLSLSVSLGCLSLSPSHSRCGPPRLRTQAPVACAASPARPPGSPSSRRPRRAENSQLAAPAPLCETFAPPHT